MIKSAWDWYWLALAELDWVLLAAGHMGSLARLWWHAPPPSHCVGMSSSTGGRAITPPIKHHCGNSPSTPAASLALCRATPRLAS